jgi:histidinol dehydrogenase
MEFLKHSSLIQSDANWLHKYGETIVTLANHEGLPAHAEAIRQRL